MGDTFDWIGAGSGAFGDPLDWVDANNGNNAVPGPSDNAGIIVASGVISGNGTVSNLGIGGSTLLPLQITLSGAITAQPYAMTTARKNQPTLFIDRDELAHFPQRILVAGIGDGACGNAHEHRSEERV